MSISSDRRVRWLLAGTLLAAGLLAQVAVADSSPPLPNAGCVTFTDPAGDAAIVTEVSGVMTPALTPSDPDVDITSVTLASPPGKIRAYFHLLALGTPAYPPGDRFQLTFTLNGKRVVIYGGRFSPSPLETARSVVQPLSLGTLSASASVRYNGVAAGTPEVTYDPDHSLVVITAARAPLEQVAHVTLADGMALEGVFAEAMYDGPEGTLPGDTARPANGADPYKLGDNHCFGGSPGPTPTPSPSPTPTPSSSPTPTPSPSPTPTPTQTGTAGLFDQPRAGCNAFTDPAGDAAPSPLGNDADLDVDRVNFRTTTDALSVFVHIATLGASAGAPFNGHRFTISFTTAGKVISLTADAAGPAAATVGGTANASLKATAVFDQAKSNVVVTVPLADLASVTGAPTTGATLTGTKVTTAALIKELGREFAADTATGTTDAQKTYAIGDNTCFLPPPGVLSIESDPSGQYSDTTEFVATLNDANGDAVAGVPLTLGLAGTAMGTGTTDADGAVDLTIPITRKSGAASLTASFAGNAVVGPASASSAFAVLIEKSVLTAAASKGTVTAKLLDDDKTALPGLPVTFTVGSKKTTVKTDSKGLAKLSNLKKGTSVSIAFVGVKDFYAAANTVTAKAG